MSCTYEGARDEILTLVDLAWQPSGYDIVWPNKAAPSQSASPLAPWAKVTLRHATGRQASLSGAQSTQLWGRLGVLIVEIRVPAGSGLSSAYQLGKLLTDAFEGAATGCGVWFRNVRLNEVGPDGNWYQVNFLADFEYTEVKPT